MIWEKADRFARFSLSLQQPGHFLLRRVALRQSGDGRLHQDLVLGHDRGRRRIIGGLNRILSRLHVLLLRAQHLADGVEGIDLRADVAVLRSHVVDGRVDGEQGTGGQDKGAGAKRGTVLQFYSRCTGLEGRLLRSLL